jgi:hypothetical protein
MTSWIAASPFGARLAMTIPKGQPGSEVRNVGTNYALIAPE